MSLIPYNLERLRAPHGVMLASVWQFDNGNGFMDMPYSSDEDEEARHRIEVGIHQVWMPTGDTVALRLDSYEDLTAR